MCERERRVAGVKGSVSVMDAATGEQVAETESGRERETVRQ